MKEPIMYYLALAFESDGGFDFVCPDVPGFTAHSDSSSFNEAVAVAREVLTGHLATLIDNGASLPPARDLEDLRSDADLAEDFAEASTSIMLPALLPAGRARRVNLSLDENTLDLIDTSARDRGLTRSAFVAEACRAFATGGRNPLRVSEACFDTAQAREESYDWFRRCLAGFAAETSTRRFGSRLSAIESLLDAHAATPAPDIDWLTAELHRQFLASAEASLSREKDKLRPEG